MVSKQTNIQCYIDEMLFAVLQNFFEIPPYTNCSWQVQTCVGQRGWENVYEHVYEWRQSAL